MVYTQENFLPLELFDWLSETANLKSKLSLELAKDFNNRNYAKHHQLDKTGWDLTYRNLNGDITTPTREIGDKVSEIISHINNTIKFVTNSDVPTIDNIHFLFSKTGYVVQKHIDRRFKITPPRKLEKIYKTFIFCHKEWNENWGGELCFNSGNFLPTPNRFIMYSIDELHWVNKVNDNNNAIRINFGCRFGKE